MIPYSLAIRRIEEVVNEEPNPDGAKELDSLTRNIIFTYSFQSEKSDVNEKIVPLFKRVINYCRKLSKKTLDKKYFDEINRIQGRLGAIVESCV